MQLNHVFEAAQKAADQYIENVHLANERKIRETEEYCQWLESRTRKKCRELQNSMVEEKDIVNETEEKTTT